MDQHQRSAERFEPSGPPNEAGLREAQGRLTSDQQTFLTAGEASQLFRLDESTVYRHLRAGTFPGVKIGGRYVVPRAVVDRLVADVLATGRCVDLGNWTEQWRDAHRSVINELNGRTAQGRSA